MKNIENTPFTAGRKYAIIYGHMKNCKLFLVGATILVAAGVFAGDASLVAGQAGVALEPEELQLSEKMTLLALQIGLILFAAKLGGMLASLFKLPSVLGELAAGILIGPWCLGGIGFGDGLFKYGLFRGGELEMIKAATGNAPFAVTPELYGICTIASVVLLFLSGIETNLKMFLKFAFAGSLVGIGGVVASFLFGDLCAVYLLPKFLPGSFGYLAALADQSLVHAIMDPAAMFMGIMGTATSVGITARILSERRKMDTEEGVTIMAGAVIDDVLGIIVLAIGMGIISAQAAAGAEAKKGVEWAAIGMVALKAFGIWLGGTILGVVLARRISWLLKLFKSPVAIGTLAFGLSLVIAGLFEAMGLTLIIGAYVMGLALSRTDLKYMIQENLQSVYTFLVPVFFCVMGMMVDCKALCSRPVLEFGAIYTLLAVLAKIVGCAIPSLFCGFNLRGALRVGAGMIPRGEVALIIAGIGVSTMVNGKPILSAEVFGIGILMTLVTTIIAPPTLVALFVSPAKGVRHPRPSTTGSREISFELSSNDVAGYVLAKLVAEFRSEGFFSTCLSQESDIWEVTMDDMEIALRREENQIFVQCTPAEEAMVMTAWMEVASQMNDLARSISKPVRREPTESAATDDSKAKKSPRNVRRYLQGFVMLPGFHATSKKEAIEKIVAEIARVNPNHVKDAASATAAVLHREESMPTGLDHGIAVPHGRDANVEGIAGAVAIVDNSNSAGGCIADYETIDKSRVEIIVLTLANTEEQTPYLQLMACISRMLRDNDGYRRLAACKTADEMRKFFRDAK